MASRRPTDEQRRMVRAFAGFGVPQADIATHLGVDPKTLRRNFREELDRGMIEANAKVAQSLFRMATEGNNVAAAIFWMKARGRWREIPVDDGGNQEVRVTIRHFAEELPDTPCIDGAAQRGGER